MKHTEHHKNTSLDKEHKNHEHHKNRSGHQSDSNQHSGHHAMMIKDFRKRFWLSVIITLPILVLSPMLQSIFGYSLQFTYSSYILFAMSTIIFFYGGWPFLTGFVDEIKKRQPGMMTLIAMAITIAFGYSSATTFGLQGKKFFWELATLIDIMLLGHWVEMKSVMGASQSLQKLVQMLPSTAHKIESKNNINDVKTDQLHKGDLVLVKPGEKIPVDGTIKDGESAVNESMITGESKPVSKKKNDSVIGGTINGNGALQLKVKQVGENAYLSKVIDMVKSAQQEKSKSQKTADKVAFWLTIIALTVGLVTLTAWLINGKPFVFAMERMASVMVITCPHALGLAIPLVVAISTSVSAQNGLLIKNRTAFENARKITMMVFDKTGTLTKGNFAVSGVESFRKDIEENRIIKYAAALEANSEHPISEAIVKKAKELNLDVPSANNFNAITGKGIEGKVENVNVKVVSPEYVREKKIQIPEKANMVNKETIVFVLFKNELAGFIALSDEIRPEAHDAIITLRQIGLKLYMITGDNEEVAKSVSQELKLDGYFAEVLPDEKLKKIKQFQKEGEFVAMTGDGVNDAPALATADVGIAVGSGTDVAAETADIVLVNSNPKDIAKMVVYGKETYKKMTQNFIWATGYNVVTIPLAAGVLYGAGILINPAFGAVLMSLSTIVVAINARLLKRKMLKQKVSNVL